MPCPGPFHFSYSITLLYTILSGSTKEVYNCSMDVRLERYLILILLASRSMLVNRLGAPLAFAIQLGA